VAVLTFSLFTTGIAEGKGKSQPQLSLFAKAQHDPITRGSDQTILVKVVSNGNAISGATIYATVTYASGTTTKSFNGTSDSNGLWSFTWQIGGNSNPGTFTVNIKAFKSGYDSANASLTFQVVPKN
jgi:hypothetical protein